MKDGYNFPPPAMIPNFISDLFLSISQKYIFILQLRIALNFLLIIFHYK